MMLIKKGDGKILDVIKEEDVRVDDTKAHQALAKAKQGSSENSGNKTESTTDTVTEAETK